MIADERPEQSSRCRAACLYRLDRLFFREKLIIARNSNRRGEGCLPASASAAGVKIRPGRAQPTAHCAEVA